MGAALLLRYDCAADELTPVGTCWLGCRWESFGSRVDTPPRWPYGAGVWGLARTATPTGATRCQPPDENINGGFLMARQRRVTITFPDGTDQHRWFPPEDDVIIEPEGEWLNIGVVHATGEMVKNTLGTEGPERIHVFTATVWHGHVTTELLLRSDDA